MTTSWLLEALMNFALPPVQPLPPVPAGPYKVVAFDVIAILKAIRYAWNLLPIQAVDGKTLSSKDYEDEDTVTKHLVSILNRMLTSKTLHFFTDQRFQSVCRDAKMSSFDGRKDGLMPDLVFRTVGGAPVGVDERYGIFVESKVLGIGQKRIPLYVKNGLYRFICGDYAWAMNQGIMLGYLMKDHQIPKYFEDYTMRANSSPKAQQCKPIHACSVPAFLQGDTDLGHVYKSEHLRTFNVDGMPAGNIEVLHLWLKRP